MSSKAMPEVLYTYQNPVLDSTKWNHYIPRDDDIIITTSIKSGTSWMQNIVLQLIFLGQPVPALSVTSFWLEFRPAPIGDQIEKLEAQSHRRFIKTHLPLDGLPYYPQVKYIVVGRDARDVFMSFWNHYSHISDATFKMLNDTPGRIGDPLPPCPEDIHEFWRDWISRGWFDWESEGYPHWGNMHHTQTWWDFRHLENILFIHFNDLLADLAGEIGRIASYLEIDLSPEDVSTVAQAVSFSSVKQNPKMSPLPSQDDWQEGFQFFFKGTNGRWQDILTDEELAMYEATKSKVLTPECARWLEQGQVAL